MGHHRHLGKNAIHLDRLRGRDCLSRCRLVEAFQIDADRPGKASAERAGALGGHRLTSGVGIRDLERCRQPQTLDVRRPSAETPPRAEIAQRIPRLAERQIVGDAVNQRTALDFFEQPPELPLLLPNAFVGMPRDVDHLVVLAPNVRTVQIERGAKPAVRPVRHEGPQRSNGRVGAGTDIVAVVVATVAVLALVARFDTVLVHKWNRHDLDVAPEPLTIVAVGQDDVEDAFQNEAGERLAGMVPGGQQDPKRRIAVELPRMNPLDRPAALGLAEFVETKIRVIRKARDEFLQVGFDVRYREAEPHVGGVPWERVCERAALHSVGSEP